MNSVKEQLKRSLTHFVTNNIGEWNGSVLRTKLKTYLESVITGSHAEILPASGNESYLISGSLWTKPVADEPTFNQLTFEVNTKATEE